MHLTDNFCMMCGTKREEEPQMLEETTVDAEAVVTDIPEEEEEYTEEQQKEEEMEEIEEAEEPEETEQPTDTAEDKTEKEEEGIDPSEFEI